MLEASPLSRGHAAALAGGAGRRREWGLVLLGSLLLVCGSGPIYVMPAYLAGVATTLRLGASEIGHLSGIETAAIALAAALASLWTRRIGWQVLLAAAFVAAVGNMIAGGFASFHGLLAARGLTGLFGEGALYAASYVVLGATARPDRAFGIGATAVGLVSAAALDLAGPLNRMAGPVGVLLPFAACALLVAPALRLLPHERPWAAAARRDWAAAPPARLLRPLLLVAAMAIWTAAPNTFWAFSEVATAGKHVSEASVGKALSIALVAGLGGGLLPVLIGDRFGRLLPIALATTGLFGSTLLYLKASDIALLTLALSVLQICWNLAIVIMLAALSLADRTGRFAALAVVMQFLGAAAGQALCGMAIAAFGYGAFMMAVTGFLAVGLLLFAAAETGAWSAVAAKQPATGARTTA